MEKTGLSGDLKLQQVAVVLQSQISSMCTVIAFFLVVVRVRGFPPKGNFEFCEGGGCHFKSYCQKPLGKNSGGKRGTLIACSNF